MTESLAKPQKKGVFLSKFGIISLVTLYVVTTSMFIVTTYVVTKDNVSVNVVSYTNFDSDSKTDSSDGHHDHHHDNHHKEISDFNLPKSKKSQRLPGLRYRLDNDVRDRVASRIPPISEEDNELRLPTDLSPKHYVVELQPFIEEAANFTVTGHVEITFNVVEETNQIVFHILDMTIDTTKLELLLDGSDSGLQFVSFDHDRPKNFYSITLDNSLTKGSDYTLKLDFTGYMNDILVGFYRSSYVDNSGTTHLLGTTQFEATDARRAFPCFDEPAMKATFQIKILREGTERGSISNMPLIESYEASAPWEGWYWDIFQPTVPMSTYLVAFIVSDFVNKTSNENDHVTFGVWAREEAIDQADYALDIGPDILTFFEGYFDIPFPLPKQDMAALPDFDAGAMENWGLITYRETALLYDPEFGSASNLQRVGVVVAHELAHQWFGDLVSPEWWTYLWLNEGFASYMEYVGLDSREPTFGMLDQFVLDSNLYAFSIDCLETSHPITVVVTDPAQIWEIFDAISYNKGASIIRMMEYFLSTATFKKALTNYLNDLKYSTATQDDLWQFMTDAAHEDLTLPQELTVKQIMDTWTLQMGYPVLNIERSDEYATVTQDRFLLIDSGTSNDTNVYMWWIPITFTTHSNPDFSDTSPYIWMRQIDKSIVINTKTPTTEWIIVNLQLGSFYRVNYDATNWELIRQQLIDDNTVIAPANRAQISDDSMNLARAGMLGYGTALDISLYLQYEKEYVPWSASLRNLGYLEEMFTATSGYGGLEEFFLTLLVPTYNDVGFNDKVGEDTHMEELMRSMILSWTCHMNYASCVDNATDLYALWMTDPEANAISPNQKSTVYCIGIAEGDQTEWDFAWNQYLASNLGSEKDYLLYAMGCSKEQWILERYLEWGLTSESYGIKKQDSYKVFNSVAGNDIGNKLAWDYLVTNWNDMAVYYGSPVTCSDYAYSVSDEFNTEAELAELQALSNLHYEELNGATQSFDQALENVQNNINWMNNYYDEIHSWLTDNNFGNSI